MSKMPDKSNQFFSIDEYEKKLRHAAYLKNLEKGKNVDHIAGVQWHRPNTQQIDFKGNSGDPRVANSNDKSKMHNMQQHSDGDRNEQNNGSQEGLFNHTVLENQKTPVRQERAFVYFIQVSKGEQGGLIKIGYSNNPIARLKEFQTSTPDKLILLGCMEGDLSTEARLHKRFNRFRKRGEWFTPAAELIQYITTNAKVPSEFGL